MASSENLNQRIKITFFPELNEDNPGKYRSYLNVIVDNLNYEEVKEDYLTELRSRINRSKESLYFNLSKHFVLIDRTKINDLYDDALEDFFLRLKDTPRQLEELLKIYNINYMPYRNVTHSFVFDSSLEYKTVKDVKKITEFKICFETYRGNVFDTSRWVPPPRHLEARYIKTYHKVYSL